MSTSSALRPSILAAAGLVGGFVAARYTGNRAVGGVVFAVAGGLCSREWSRASGPVMAAALSTIYTAAMGGSHPLAKKLGPWGSVLTVAAGVAAASELATRAFPGRNRAR